MKKVLISLISGLFASTCFANTMYYDKLPITPNTWQKIELSYTKPINGKDYTEYVKLVRPMSWLKQNHLDKPGTSVQLNPQILGKSVMAAIEKVESVTFSYSNNAGNNLRPVIATYLEHNDDVGDYKFSNGEIMQAASRQPVYSLDRHRFLPIGQIKAGERFKTANGSPVQSIGKIKQHKGGELVYTFEVYQDHNYQVGRSVILVHNYDTPPCARNGSGSSGIEGDEQTPLIPKPADTISQENAAGSGVPQLLDLLNRQDEIYIELLNSALGFGENPQSKKGAGSLIDQINKYYPVKVSGKDAKHISSLALGKEQYGTLSIYKIPEEYQKWNYKGVGIEAVDNSGMVLAVVLKEPKLPLLDRIAKPIRQFLGTAGLSTPYSQLNEQRRKVSILLNGTIIDPTSSHYVFPIKAKRSSMP